MADPIIPRDQLAALAGEDKYVEGVVDVTLMEVIEEDYGGLNKLLAERLIGEDIQEKLTDITFNIVSHKDDTLSMKVRGSIYLWLRDKPEPVIEKEESESE